MMKAVDRRSFLSVALGGAAVAAAPRLAFAQDAPMLAAAPLTDRLVLITGAGANVVAAVAADGLILIDGGLERNAQALLDFALRETGATQVGTLVNSHWHPEQTGLNRLLGAAGTRIVAHENTRLWLASDIDAADNTLIHAALPQSALPTETFHADHAIPFAGGEARLSYALQAHTDGDILTHFPDDDVIVAGGVIRTDGWPEIDWWTGGWMGATGGARANNVAIPTYGGMLGGLQAIIALAGDNTRIVPASGPVVDRAEAQAQLDMYAALAGTLREALYSAQGPEDVLAMAPLAGMRPEWGSPDEFLAQAFRSLWPHLTPDA